MPAQQNFGSARTLVRRIENGLKVERQLTQLYRQIEVLLHLHAFSQPYIHLLREKRGGALPGGTNG